MYKFTFIIIINININLFYKSSLILSKKFFNKNI